MIVIAPLTENTMSYDEALLYCAFLDYNGHRDWRLPTRDEYDSNVSIWGWYAGRSSEWAVSYKVCPVRDIC